MKGTESAFLDAGPVQALIHTKMDDVMNHCETDWNRASFTVSEINMVLDQGIQLNICQ